MAGAPKPTGAAKRPATRRVAPKPASAAAPAAARGWEPVGSAPPPPSAAVQRAAVPEPPPRRPTVDEPVWLVRAVIVLFLVGFAAFLAREVYSFVQSLG